MTTDEAQFLNEVWHYFNSYSHKETVILRVGDPDFEGQRETKIALLNAMIEVVEHYFRDTLGYYDSGGDFYTSGNDLNFFTVGEIQQVIDHMNLIMETTAYIDLSS